MSKPPPGAVTELLQAWSNGDKGALDELIPVVYSEIHKLAHNYLRREEPGNGFRQPSSSTKPICN